MSPSRAEHPPDEAVCPEDGLEGKRREADANGTQCRGNGMTVEGQNSGPTTDDQRDDDRPTDRAAEVGVGGEHTKP